MLLRHQLRFTNVLTVCAGTATVTSLGILSDGGGQRSLPSRRQSQYRLRLGRAVVKHAIYCDTGVQTRMFERGKDDTGADEELGLFRNFQRCFVQEALQALEVEAALFLLRLLETLFFFWCFTTDRDVLSCYRT